MQERGNAIPVHKHIAWNRTHTHHATCTWAMSVHSCVDDVTVDVEKDTAAGSRHGVDSLGRVSVGGALRGNAWSDTVWPCALAAIIPAPPRRRADPCLTHARTFVPTQTLGAHGLDNTVPPPPMSVLLGPVEGGSPCVDRERPPGNACGALSRCLRPGALGLPAPCLTRRRTVVVPSAAPARGQVLPFRLRRSLLPPARPPERPWGVTSWSLWPPSGAALCRSARPPAVGAGPSLSVRAQSTSVEVPVVSIAALRREGGVGTHPACSRMYFSHSLRVRATSSRLRFSETFRSRSACRITLVLIRLSTLLPPRKLGAWLTSMSHALCAASSMTSNPRIS
eukprot:m.386661 g.386661  ORF g.386661 m.386661 type:complete len:338 (-) comp21019_c0_seq2:1174-2187(-)